MAPVKVDYKSQVSYPPAQASSPIKKKTGGESGNESDAEEDDGELDSKIGDGANPSTTDPPKGIRFGRTAIHEVFDHSRLSIVRHRANRHSTRLSKMFKKCGSSWDKVLLNIVGDDVPDGRDVKVTLNMLLYTHSARVDATDEYGDTALHRAARSGKLEAVEMLLEADACTTTKNAIKEYPVLLALRMKHDRVAALLMQFMPPACVREIFTAPGYDKCAYSFHTLINNEKEMKESLTSALDSMWEPLEGKPNKFKFFLQVLDSDEHGRTPKSRVFSGRTALQCIAKKSNKTAVYHNVVRILLWHKWNKFVRNKFWAQAGFFLVYVIGMTIAMMIAGSADDPTEYRSGLDIFRAICEALSILFCLYGLAAEFNKLYKHGPDYFQDLYNYVDMTSFSLILVIIPLRFTASPAQWTVASFAYIATCLRFFKYTCVIRIIGVYTQVLGRIVRTDIVRFMIIFCIFLVTFSGSFYLALRGEEEAMFSLKENRTLTISDLDKPEYYHTRSYPEILLTGLRIMIEGRPIIDYYKKSSELGWLGIVLIMLYLFIVIVVLLSILIAQLADTFRNKQSDAQREVELNRAYIVGHVEKNSLLYRNLLAKNYIQYIEVEDPVSILEKWECPPMNDLHRQLHCIRNHLEHHDSSLLIMEQTQLLEDLKDVCVDQSQRIKKLLCKLKRKRREERRKQWCREGAGHSAADNSQHDGHSSSSESPSDSHTVLSPTTSPIQHASDVRNAPCDGDAQTTPRLGIQPNATSASTVNLAEACSDNPSPKPTILPELHPSLRRLDALKEGERQVEVSLVRPRAKSSSAAGLNQCSRSPRIQCRHSIQAPLTCSADGKYESAATFSPRLAPESATTSPRLAPESATRFSPMLAPKSAPRFSPRLGHESQSATRFSPRLGRESATRFSPRLAPESGTRFSPKLSKCESETRFSPRLAKRQDSIALARRHTEGSKTDHYSQSNHSPVLRPTKRLHHGFGGSVQHLV